MWAPAQKNASCAECLEIAGELNEAYADDPLQTGQDASSKPTDAETTKAASEALRRLVGGTEEDAEIADELLDRCRFQARHYSPKVPPAATQAMHRFVQHAARSGHSLRPVVG